MDPPVVSVRRGEAREGDEMSHHHHHHRLALDPIATSPVSNHSHTDNHDNHPPHDLDVTVSTPTGSTEIVSHYSASNDSSRSHNHSYSSDQENEGTPQQQQQQQQHWIPPPDLSAFKLSRDSMRDPTSPSNSVVRAELESLVMPLASRTIQSVASPTPTSFRSTTRSTPLVTTTNDHDAAAAAAAAQSPVSPPSLLLQLPLPPGKRTLGATSPPPSTSSTSATKTTSMTRKAQRYSSLKKRNTANHTATKNGTNNTNTTSATAHTLLNRLFCHTPNGSSNSHTNTIHTSGMDDDAPAAIVGTLSVRSGGGSSSNSAAEDTNNNIHTTATSPRPRKSMRTPTTSSSRPMATPSTPTTTAAAAAAAGAAAVGTCVSLGADFFREASESLSRNNNSNEKSGIRNSIQTKLQDSFMACSGGGNRDVSCGLSSSPPTYTSCTQAAMDNNCRVAMSASDDSILSGPQQQKQSVVRLVGDAAVGSTSSTRKSSSRVSSSPRRKPVVVVDDDNDIAEPDTRLSMFLVSDDDDIAETVPSQKPPNVIMMTTAVSGDDMNHATSPTKSQSMSVNTSRSMKTPGGLVIPSPFTHSGKGLFPSSADHLYGKSSSAAVHPKSPSKDRWSPRRNKATSPRRMRRPPSSPSGSTIIITQHVPETMSPAAVVDPVMVADPPLPELLPMDKMMDLSVNASSSSSLEASSHPPRSSGFTGTQDQQQPGLSEQGSDKPSETIAVVLPPIESAVREMSTNAVEKKGVTYFSSSIDSTDNEVTLSSSSCTAAVANLPAAIAESREVLVRNCVEPFQPEIPISSIFDPIDLPSIQSKDSIDCTLEELKAKYERKINEQKDQAALANRVARMRLEEISRLEAQIDTLAERQVDEDELLKLKDRLRQTQQEKKKEVDRVRKEMETRIDDQKKRLEETMKPLSDFQRMEQELTAVKKQLELKQVSEKEVHHETDDLAVLKTRLKAAKEASPTKKLDTSSLQTSTELSRLSQELTLVKEESEALKRELKSKVQSSDLKSTGTDDGSPLEDEIFRLRRELADATVKLTVAASSSAPSNFDIEMEAVKEELSKVTASLAEKESELQTIHSSSPGSRSDSPLRSSIRFTSPMTPPKRSISKSKRNSGGDGKSKHHDDIAEIHEREKECLRQQIELLDNQATESNQEHEKALAELRQTSESEIARLKKEMECKLEKHLTKEREIKQTLSEVSSREKDELLEQIDRLQVEKKAERNGGLREVQKKEELLQRVSSMEAQEKRLIEDHERAIRDLRTVGEQEIQKLRSQMLKQEEARVVSERELKFALSETSSYEKDEMVQKSEKLHALLEKERDGLVLCKIQIANMERESESLKREHNLATKKLQTATDAEIERLQRKISELSSMEATMQIASNEKEESEKEIQRLSAKIEKDSTSAARILEALREQHASELEELTKATSGRVETAERVAHERLKETEEKAAAQLKDLQKKNDELIETIRTDHAAETEKLQREVRDVEEMYKVLITESNGQFEAFQNEANAKIKELEQERQNAKAESSDLEIKLRTNENEFREKYDLLLANQAAHDDQMKEADDVHNKQFEDLLNQLDLVEAEHQQTTTLKEKALSEKDAIIDALGSQLAEARRKMSDAEKESQQKADVAEDSHRKRSALEEQCMLLTSEIQELKDFRKKFTTDAAVEKERACEDAREEMIEKAEIQFQQANEHYIKLRKQYDESQERIKKLDGEVKVLKKRYDKITNEKESHEIDMKSEIAKLHAANAKIEAESAIKAKDYRRELERLLTTAKDFEAKADEAGKTSRSIQTTLATVVAEKERLRKEYDDMKSVSEELIAIVEGRERHEC